jgi:hypothetical protein
MVRIRVNKNRSGQLSNFIFGICCVLDGLVRIFTLGYLFSSFQLDYSREQARIACKNMKKL